MQRCAVVPARPLTFRDGIGTGVAVLATAAACYLATATIELRQMYAQFGDVALPVTTRLVQHPVWLYGVPLALIAAIVVGHVWRPRHALIAIAALAIAVDVFWYVAAWAPIYDLAGMIR